MTNIKNILVTWGISQAQIDIVLTSEKVFPLTLNAALAVDLVKLPKVSISLVDAALEHATAKHVLTKLLKLKIALLEDQLRSLNHD